MTNAQIKALAEEAGQKARDAAFAVINKHFGMSGFPSGKMDTFNRYLPRDVEVSAIRLIEAKIAHDRFMES